MAAGIQKIRQVRLGITKVNHYKILKSNRGASILFIIVLFALGIFIGQQFILKKHLDSLKSIRYNQIREARISLLKSLEEIITNESGLQNSRFSINSSLEQCITGVPAPCDERVLYEMVLFTPNPPVTFTGLPWPAAPAGIDRLAGGLTSNKVVYNTAGGRCDSFGIFDLTVHCPIQAIIQFRPLCAGTTSIPQLSATPGLCSGPANGFEFTAGIGILMNDQFVYHQRTGQDGDAVLLRVSVNVFNN